MRRILSAPNSPKNTVFLKAKTFRQFGFNQEIKTTGFSVTRRCASYLTDSGLPPSLPQQEEVGGQPTTGGAVEPRRRYRSVDLNSARPLPAAAAAEWRLRLFFVGFFLNTL